MTLAEIIPLAIKVSIFLIVFAIGLKTKRGDAIFLLSHPSLMARSLLCMNVIMVIAAMLFSILLDLPVAVEVAIVALAISPVPPILPPKQHHAGGSDPYAISLLATAAIAAVVLAPLATLITGWTVGRAAWVSPHRVLTIMLVTVIAPLLLGIAVRFFLPALATRLARPLAIGGTLLLAIAAIPVLINAIPTFWGYVGNGAILSLVGFTVIGIALGHALGGPRAEDRSVLALATGTRHPAIAIAIAGASFPDEQAIHALVIMHLVIGAIVSAPYVRWRRGMSADPI